MARRAERPGRGFSGAARGLAASVRPPSRDALDKLHAVARDLLGLMTLRAASIAAKFALTLFIAHYLGLAPLGVYGIIVSATVLASVLLGFGVFNHLGREAVRSGPDRGFKVGEQEPFLCLGLALNPASVASLLLDAAAEDRSAAASPGLGVGWRPARAAGRRAAAAQASIAPGIARCSAPLVEREILWRLLWGEQAGTVRQIGLADSRLSHVARAIRWIRANYAERMRIEDLADLAAMSVASFHRHFRAVTAMTPAEYQRQIRLQCARARLLTRRRRRDRLRRRL